MHNLLNNHESDDYNPITNRANSMIIWYTCHIEKIVMQHFALFLTLYD